MRDHISELRIEPIAREHERASFDCGKAPLNDYLYRHARQNDKKKISKTFVAVSNNNRVLGYYSLCTASIEFEELPEGIRKQLSPAALIAKLAVDESLCRQGLGARLLIDALQRIVSASSEIGIKAILVDTIGDEALEFYRHFEFIELPGQHLKLFLPIETIQQLF